MDSNLGFVDYMKKDTFATNPMRWKIIIHVSIVGSTFDILVINLRPTLNAQQNK